MKVLFVFQVFVFLSTNALATVCEDRFISAEFVVNIVFIYDRAMLHVIASFVISRHDVTGRDRSKRHFAPLCAFLSSDRRLRLPGLRPWAS